MDNNTNNNDNNNHGNNNNNKYAEKRRLATGLVGDGPWRQFMEMDIASEDREREGDEGSSR